MRVFLLSLVLLVVAGFNSEIFSASQDKVLEPAGSAPAIPAPTKPAAQPTRDGPAYAHHVENADLRVFRNWEGDLPQMIDRRVIRALVPWSDTYYYLDGFNQRGVSYEILKLFENWLNEEVGSGTVEMHVVILPVRRDLLLEYVRDGRGDIALGGISITDQRRQWVDFSDPISRDIHEWLVESPSAERVEDLEDLSGRIIYVRQSSSYWESLAAINARFAEQGLEPIDLKPANEYLSTEDLLQMADADAVPYTVADHEIARYWSNVLTEMRVREDIVIREETNYAWAMRKNSPELKAVVNRFIADHRQGTLLGNVIINRYFKDTDRLHKTSGEVEKQRIRELSDYFDSYASEYGFDALMMLAQGFQESRLDQSKKSNRGAIGVMQLLPSTAADPAVGIPDISTAENNILAGIRYMAWIRDTYFDDPELDDLSKTALAFASYNAGPNRVRGLRQKAAARGLDPNRWFDNVELIAAEEIGRETVESVANIHKYYIAFKLSQEHKDS